MKKDLVAYGVILGAAVVIFGIMVLVSIQLPFIPFTNLIATLLFGLVGWTFYVIIIELLVVPVRRMLNTLQKKSHD